MNRDICELIDKRRCSEETSVFSSVSVVLFYFSLVLKDFLSCKGFGFLAISGMVLGIAGATIEGVRTGRLKAIVKQLPPMLAPILVVSFFLSNAYSLVVLKRVNVSPFYMGFFVAIILVASNSNAFLKALFVLPIIQLVAQIYEQSFGELLFPTIVNLQDFVVDVEKWSIGAEAIRTKGFFQGPLHIVSICLVALLVNPRSPILHLVFIIAAYFGGARLGLVMSILLSFYFIISCRKSVYLLFIWTIVSVLSVCLFIIYLAPNLDQDRISFLMMFFNFDMNEANIARVSVWQESIKFYLSYDLPGMLFGRFDEIRLTTDHASTESDWLRILVDNGLLCFSGYLYAFYKYARAIRSGKVITRPLHLGFLFLAMNLYPCLGWLAAATAFWVIYSSQMSMVRRRPIALQIKRKVNSDLKPEHIISYR